MDFIHNLSNKFVCEYFESERNNYEQIIAEANNWLSKINSQIDKIRFLNVILAVNEEYYQKHLRVCQDKEGCPKNFSHENISYFLNQELSRLGVKIDEDAFTFEEKNEANNKLDEILGVLETLKAGQQVIFEEIDELRELYFLGKKNWSQLLLGKASQMVTAGIVSETVSKQLVGLFNGYLETGNLTLN